MVLTGSIGFRLILRTKDTHIIIMKYVVATIEYLVVSRVEEGGQAREIPKLVRSDSGTARHRARWVKILRPYILDLEESIGW